MSIAAGLDGAAGGFGESSGADGPKLDPELEREKLEVEARKAIAEAELAIADARRKQIAAFIPDVSSIKTGETTLRSDQPLAAAGLIYRAVESAAGKLVSGITDGELPPGSRVLITDDLDLATVDAVYLEVTSGLTRMIEAADAVVEVIESQRSFAETVGAVVGAIAAALPGVISLFSAHRTVSSATATVDAAATMAIVAGKLQQRGCVVTVDDFRLVPTAGAVLDAETALRTKVTTLRARKLIDKVAQDTAEAAKAAAQLEIDELMKRLDKGGTGNEGPTLEPRLAEARRRRENATVTAVNAAARLAAIDQVLGLIDPFLLSLRAVPAGGKRSPLAAAALHQELHGADATSALFIKAVSGSTDQAMSDRPLWLKDKFHVVATACISYILLHPGTDAVEGAGVAYGESELRIDLGRSFEIQTDSSS